MRRAAAAACLLVAGTLLAAPQTAPAPPLEGTRWMVKVTPDETSMKKGEKVFDDTLVFSGGKVSMTECVKFGFQASNYTATKSGYGWSFKTEQTSEASGTNAWSADGKGDAIKGKLVWTKKDGTVLSYTFEGKKAS